ncbi:hypothetical protein JIG36_35145 [Actinoplanes sp. LDG1-06]|uniref:TPM domain-containing protein n=1 Tax=Paractinoplanes ovalisporus TaxID=2810368 RepID=A0ABS2ALT3_9ACTN|nr:hypothetical protein [Actinoplanes ovalisporus]MBM2620750.1 hypothetical protein [Actinoplanes ovalisporus]
MRRLLRSPFGLAVVGCLVLAGWALWTGGLLDDTVARTVRGSSVYAAPSYDLDRAAAERVLGNRRVVVLLLDPGADLRDSCGGTERAAAGTVVLAVKPDGEGGFDRYGCAWLPGRDDENFGRAAVAETVIGDGIDAFADRPLEALKVVAVNYDRLVRAGTVPDGARTISPSLPRYLLVAAAFAGVLAGAAAVWAGGRRAARRAAARLDRREAAADARSTLSAASATLAQQIIDLDRAARPAAVGPAARRLAADYATLLEEITAADSAGGSDQQWADLTARCRAMIKRAAESRSSG